MCPAITAEPMAPGRALPVYQPATDVLDGPCSAPLAGSPRWTSVVLTPIDGMTRATGLATRRTDGSGTGACLPTGIGANVGLPRGAAGRPVWLATARPVTPAATARMPQMRMAAATGRRTTRMGEVCRPTGVSFSAGMHGGAGPAPPADEAAG